MATPKRKSVESKTAEKQKIPAEQGKSKAKSRVGYKRPPKEHQFTPGQRGNPYGPPVRSTNLWVWFCKYMALTDDELAKLDRSKLTQAQQAALKLTENMKAGKGSGSQRLALSVFDREEGKAVEHFVIEGTEALSESECDEIRKMLPKNHAD